ncbi:MARTX multifunctional-autoprocessing repeats-in-toxin holotoxin RtxA [Chromobacterium sp. TRC.1.1.SA]|uniref:MARTX multifunctional-autoprocessing repeats-in-toxin holotoxin RtxA n=1 Tax=Chromobacterium indicum TaxID=3110228 RepID=A0ABV0CJH0_9NEIS
MGMSVWRSVQYFFTGSYVADDGDNTITAIGFGGVIHAYGGDDYITVGSIGATVYTGTGDDTVNGGAAYLKIVDESGWLKVRGAAGYAAIEKTQSGNIEFRGLSGATSIEHDGQYGDVDYQGAALANFLKRRGVSGNIFFSGAGGYNQIDHQTQVGNLHFSGAGAGNKLERGGFQGYQGSRGNVVFSGAGLANIISSRVESGDVKLHGAGAYNKVLRQGRDGDVEFKGVGGWNELSRLRHEEDDFTSTHGDISFAGAGGYNRLISDVARGDIHFQGAGGFNRISRQGSAAADPFAYAEAASVRLISASLGGEWITQARPVTAVKSTVQSNTYLFAFFDGTYTKVNQVELFNDPSSGALRYLSTSWYQAGNHLDQLASTRIGEQTGFTSTQSNGAYRLTNLVYECQKTVQVQVVENEVQAGRWVSYGGGVKQAVQNMAITSAKLGGRGIDPVGDKLDVAAIKSLTQPNRYIFAKYLDGYTKLVVLDLVNDAETGETKYRTSAWRKCGNHVAAIAEETIAESSGYSVVSNDDFVITEIQYQLSSAHTETGRLPATQEFSAQDLVANRRQTGDSEGDIVFEGAGGGNLIESDVTQGDIRFNGAGAANIIIKKGRRGDLVFRGAGLANVLLHLGAEGRMDVYAAGVANVLIRYGDGDYLARLLAYGNISIQQGNGESQVLMLGGFNSHTHIGRGRARWLAAGGFNILTKVGAGPVDAVLAGGGNVLSVLGGGDLTAGLLGGANVITHIHDGTGAANTRVIALGGANVLTKHGDGKLQALLGGQVNVLTHIGRGDTQAIMLGAANVLTKVGNGDLSAVMLGWGNVLTHVGHGQTVGIMAAAGNIFTKVGDGTSIAAMVGAGNVFTHIGQGDAWALMGGMVNVFTKVGDGKALALMVAKGNIFTHIGNGLTVALMLAKGNVATKVGNGMTLSAMIGGANVFSQIGNGETFAVMLGKANVLTKVGDGLSAALMVGKANIYTQVGNGVSLGLFAGNLNLMTKVGGGTTLAAMFGKANVMTHVGNGMTGVLALGKANIITKVGDGFLGVLAKAKANVVTHVGNGVTAALLLGKGNVLTKVGDGATVGLLVSDVGNVLTQVGDGLQIGFAKGKANFVTKVGTGSQIAAAWGELNVLTHIGNGVGMRAAKGRANVLTKVGDGDQISVVKGDANLVTHVGDGDDYVGAWGRANLVTKVGAGRQVVLAKGDANIITQVGDGDSYQALLGRANFVTKVGNGIHVTAAKGDANLVTMVGDGLSVTATYGKFNCNLKVGSGTTVNVAWGNYNLNTQWGDGLNVAVMKGKGNANIQVGDGMMITAAYARNNVVVKVGNGDFYSLAVASSNTTSNKLAELFGNIKQTLLGLGASQAINYLVQGDEGATSGVSRQGRGGFNLPASSRKGSVNQQGEAGGEEEGTGVALDEVQQLQGFGLDEISQTDSTLASDLSGQISQPDTVDDEEQQASRLTIDEQGGEKTNLIVNGDFEQHGHGWQSTHGVEAWSASGYGLAAEEKYGQFSSELSTDRNTTIYQDLEGLRAGQVVTLDFDFARRLQAGLDHGIEVRWNGVLVFSNEGGAAEWQHKQLQFTAAAGSNRLSFSGTGPEDTLGYVIDNVSAYAEQMPDVEVPQAGTQVSQDQAAAERDRQRLEQEKSRQLEGIEASRQQLEASDEQQLSRNGDWLRGALNKEAEDATSRLHQMRQGLDAAGAKDYQGGSGQTWRDRFASNLPAEAQEQLEKSQTAASGALQQLDDQHQRQQAKHQDAVQKSEQGRQRSEEARQQGRDHVQEAVANGDTQGRQAQTQQQGATARQDQARQDVAQARQEGEQAESGSRQKVGQAQSDAKSLKQQGDGKPERDVRRATGEASPPPRDIADEPDEAVEHDGGDELDNDVDLEASTGLTESELAGLSGAKAAVNRLQINAGVRGRLPSVSGPDQTRHQVPVSRSKGMAEGHLKGLGNDGEAGEAQAGQELPPSSLLKQVSSLQNQMASESQSMPKELRIGVSFRTDGNGKAHLEHDLKAIEALNQLKNKDGEPLFPFKIVPVTLPVGASGSATPDRKAAWSDLDGINLLYIPGAPTASDVQVGSSSPSSPSYTEELNFNRQMRPEPPSKPDEPEAPDASASKKRQNKYNAELAQYKKKLAQYEVQQGQFEKQLAKFERINGEHQSRSAYELRLLEIARARGIPVMAVCAGSWRLLEAYGGAVRTLRRTSSRDNHKASGQNPWQLEHQLRLMEGKIPSQVMGSQVDADSNVEGVNSTHWAVPVHEDTPDGPKLRDGAGTPSRWLSISAEDPDTKTVEAYESRHGAPVMGLQWHPEAYLPGMLGESSGSEDARELSRAIFEYMVWSAQTAQQRTELVAAIKRHMAQSGDEESPSRGRVTDDEDLEGLGEPRRSESGRHTPETESRIFDGLISREALQREASVFAKRMGPAYRAILDDLERLPAASGDTQLAAGLALHQRVSRYLAEHPTSGRNSALGRLRAQLEDKMFTGGMQALRADLLTVARDNPQLALRLYQLAREAARSGEAELGAEVLRWARSDPDAALASLNAMIDDESGRTWCASREELVRIGETTRRAMASASNDGSDHDATSLAGSASGVGDRSSPARASTGRLDFVEQVMKQPDADLERFLLRKNPALKPVLDYVFRDIDLPDGRFSRITANFISKEHLLAFSVASSLGNFAVSAREAGGLTLERLADGAAAKGHDILEKTVKASSLAGAYGEEEGARKLEVLQQLGLAGLVGHWDPETKALLGFYVTKDLYDQRDEADAAARALGERVQKVDADHYYLPVDVSDAESMRSSTETLRNSPQWQQKMYTGDYDLHDMLSFSGRAHSVPSSSRSERFIRDMLNAAVAAKDESRPLRRGSHHTVQHGPQVSYPAHMGAHEKGVPLVGAVANPSFPLALCDRGVWQPVIHDVAQLQTAYRKMGANLKVTWQPGEDHLRFVPDGDAGQVRMERRPSEESSGESDESRTPSGAEGEFNRSPAEEDSADKRQELEGLGGDGFKRGSELGRDHVLTMENDGSAPREGSSRNPIRNFLSRELFGSREARRTVGDLTQDQVRYGVDSGGSSEVTLRGEAGRLTGYYHHSEGDNPDKKVVLFLHGSGSTCEDQASDIADHYRQQGIDMLAVNLRGYGNSDGAPDEAGFYQDARKMYRYLVDERGVSPDKIIIHGYSMGAPIAADLTRYASKQGESVAGLLLDRPMPSLTKGMAAHDVAGPAGVFGAVAKRVNGQFSVEKNLEGMPKTVPIMLLTDSEGMGTEGEKLRQRLVTAGYQVSGESTVYTHANSADLMKDYAGEIVKNLFQAEASSQSGTDDSVDSRRLKGLGTESSTSGSDTPPRVPSVDRSTALDKWRTEPVSPRSHDTAESRFDGQLIFQMENDPVAARAAARLAGKHPGKSVVVQVGEDGQYRVVYGELSRLSGKLRWQVVGHGREAGADGYDRLSGYDAQALSTRLQQVSNDIARTHNVNQQPDHVSLVGCSLVSATSRDGFARSFFETMERTVPGVSVSARSSTVDVDSQGRKRTRNEQGEWLHKAAEHKVVYSRGDDQQLQMRREAIRSGVAEGDIDLAQVGRPRRPGAQGAIADNQEVFKAPKKRARPEQEQAGGADSKRLSYSGNIQLQLGDGEFTTVNWGTSNLGIKVGTGGMKSLVFGDNNVMVHIGDGDSRHSVDIAGYRALEGAQLFIGNRNVSFNLGRSNDLIVMADKSIPTPPLVNPFDGAARIAGVLQTIAGDRRQSKWLNAQWEQWTLAGAKKYLADMVGLDQASSVDYASLTALDSQHERSSRGLKSDIEAGLNKKFNQWQASKGQQEGGKLSRADKLRQLNEKLAFNFSVGGQGADIQITTANWNFVFGDNLQSILDTNLGSLFGLLTQQFTASGMAKTTLTFTPTDLPRQLRNRLLGRLAGVSGDTTLADIFGVDYTAQGGLVSRTGEAIDAPAMLREMLSVIAEFGGEQLAAFTDPSRWLDALQAGAALGKDALSSFAKTHGLQAAEPDEKDDEKPVSESAATETDRKAFGLNALQLPNLFATLFSQDKQAEMKQLLENLKQNLSADLLNMQEQTFDFLRHSGHLQGDGDLHVSLGNYNFNWGGDGKDLGAYLGENNNFWGGRGDDVFYATGTSNIFSGGEGHDTGVLMGRENMMFGGAGDDVAVLAGRVNHAYLGDGNDQAYVFGEGGMVEGGAGQDYLVTSGNYNRIDAGDGQDFVVTIGNHNQVSLGQGDDFAVIFGNHNNLQAEHGRNQIKLMGYHAVITGGDGRDHLIADSDSKFSELNAGAGDDLLVLGGYQNRFAGSAGSDSFVFSEAVIDCEVIDVDGDDYIVLDDIDQKDIWFKRNGDDLQLLLNRCDEAGEASDQARFEQTGVATFSGYFAEKRAQLVLELGEVQQNGLRSYTALSHQAVDALVQAMSGFTPEAGQAGFTSNMDRSANSAVQTAWGMTARGESKLIL